MADASSRYAFPHAVTDERRRLDLFARRLDPLTVRRIGRLGLAPGARCLEVGAGLGSIARWLADEVGPGGEVTATDLETEWLEERPVPRLVVRQHDLRTDPLPERAFDLVHARAVLMHIPGRMAALERMAAALRPGGWLVVEEPDFGMWLGDPDPVWSAHPRAWHEAFPQGSLDQGRALLRQIHRLGLVDVGADAELDVVRPGTPEAEFYRLSLLALAGPMVRSGLLDAEEVAAMTVRPEEPDFLGCGFAHIGVWGRRPTATAGR